MNSILNIFTASVRMAVPLGYAAIAGSVSKWRELLRWDWKDS